MKSKTILLLAITLIGAAVFANSADAMLALGEENPILRWIPVDKDAIIFDLSNVDVSAQLFLFDADEPDEKMLVLDSADPYSLVYFKPSGGGWYADTVPGGMTLEASTFGFAFYSSGVGWSYYYTLSGSNGAYTLFDDMPMTRMEVLVHDMNPVPIPAAGILLGTGLMGLIAVRRRRA